MGQHPYLFRAPVFGSSWFSHILQLEALVRYLSDKIESGLRYQRELATRSAIFIWVIISGTWSLPPLVHVSDFGEVITNSWVTSPGLEPPFGYAELVSLQTF